MKKYPKKEINIFSRHNVQANFLFTVKKLFICAPTANELLDLLEGYILKLDPKTFALDWLTDDGNNSSKKHILNLTLSL